METKVCNTCSEVKPLEKFPIHSSGTRHQNRCKSCKGKAAARNAKVYRAVEAPSKPVVCPGCQKSFRSIKHEVCSSCFNNRIASERRKKEREANPLELREWFKRVILDPMRERILRRADRRMALGIAVIAEANYDTYIDANGYVGVKKLPLDHPCRNGRNRRVSQHTLVWYLHTGQVVRSPQSLHHKNGLRHDNRIENLELWEQAQPYGARAEDLIAHAIAVLQRHQPEALAPTHRGIVLS